MKIVYLITRYLPFVDTTLNLIRHFYPHLSAKAWLILAGMAISEVIFTLRTWAVWGKKAAFLVAGIAIKTVKCESYDSNSSPLKIWQSGFVERGCVMTEGNSTLIAIEWALLLKYDIGCNFIVKRHGMSQLTKAVYKDGIIYYTYLFVFSLANLLVGRRTRALMQPSHSMGRVFRASLACRGKQQWNEEESYYAPTMMLDL
ncbi:hypothetical protein BDQ17DRAFT_1363967 [Cyathus striatus]|nr:hypothetical protein BDQ17DRAFT_1363967 [Cyathus striatus]